MNAKKFFLRVVYGVACVYAIALVVMLAQKTETKEPEEISAISEELSDIDKELISASRVVDALLFALGMCDTNAPIMPLTSNTDGVVEPMRSIVHPEDPSMVIHYYLFPLLIRGRDIGGANGDLTEMAGLYRSVMYAGDDPRFFFHKEQIFYGKVTNLIGGEETSCYIDIYSLGPRQ